MRIERVTETTLCEAGEVHALAWAESHRSFCSAKFVALHTPKRQTDYLRQEMAQGKALFLLRDDIAVGVVSVRESLIENLYVRPDRQSRSYGSALLHHPPMQQRADALGAEQQPPRAGAVQALWLSPHWPDNPAQKRSVRIGNAAIPTAMTPYSPIQIPNAPKSSFSKRLRRVVRILYKK